MTALLIAALIAAPAPSQEAILRERARAAANAREKATAAALEREQVYSRPIGLPGAGETLTVPLTGKAIGSDGKVYTFSGTVTLQIDSPAPLPPATRLTGIRDPATALLVTTATAGQRLVLEGEGLLSETILVTVGGERAAVLRQSAGMIEFTVPPVPAGKSPTLVLYWLIANQWQPKGTLPLTVLQGPAPTPTPTPVPPPTPGASPRVDSIQSSGGVVVIAGSGFGGAAGRVLIDKLPVTATGWSETRITGQAAGPVLPRLTLDLQRAGEGWHTQTWEGP